MNTVMISTELATRVLGVLREVGTNLGEIEAHLTPEETERSKLLSGGFVGELFALACGVEAAIGEGEKTS